MSACLSSDDLLGFRACQRLAQDGARAVGALLQEGWSERQAASLLDVWLADHGVAAFFHHAFAWFGERTRFTGVRPRHYRDFLPSERVLRAGEPYILDVAPIYHGYIADIGYSDSLGENPEVAAAQRFLGELRQDIPKLFSAEGARGREIWAAVDQRIAAQGYENIHRLYPFSVLGHRVHRSAERGSLSILNFGWQAVWTLGKRGVLSQLLGPKSEGGLQGLWAIEPHVGGAGFGVKFEEILVVDAAGARWLADAEDVGL